MSDIQGLLDDIRENPEDDVTRLVAADWYEEHGDAVRASYMRDSVALSRLPEWDRSPLEIRRLDALARLHEKRWLGDARGLGQVEWYRRFPDSVCLTASTESRVEKARAFRIGVE
jgi:uncharacterized protein (TIGR02996 family)